MLGSRVALLHSPRMSASSRLDKIFLRGLAAFVPAALTLYIVYWTIATAETITRALIAHVVPERYLFPGMGLVIAVSVIFALGVFLSAYLARVVYGFGERLLQRIPVVKSIYGMIRDTLSFFTHQKTARYDRVVMVSIGPGVRVIGFVTRDDFRNLPAGIGDANTVGVYLPMSYQLGGYLVMVAKDAVAPVDMSMEDALRFAVTAGMGREPGSTRDAGAAGGATVA